MSFFLQIFEGTLKLTVNSIAFVFAFALIDPLVAFAFSFGSDYMKTPELLHAFSNFCRIHIHNGILA